MNIPFLDSKLTRIKNT